MAEKTFDVVVAGEINPDLILTDPQLEPRFGQAETLVQDAVLTPGSSSVIFACGAARLGLKVAFVGICGDDLFGRFMLDALQSSGVDISRVTVDPGRQTGVTVILNRISDRAMLTYPGAMNALRAGDVSDELLVESRHLHIASYFLQTALQPDLPKLLDRARALGLSTSLDTNWDPDEAWTGVYDLLPRVDVFLPNENEVCALTGIDNLEDAARALAARGTVVAVKLGRAGGLALTADGATRAATIRVNVADTVGAGDSFDAGFIYGYIKGWPLADALQLGVVCGSLSTRKSGGLEGQPTLEEALSHFIHGEFR